MGRSTTWTSLMTCSAEGREEKGEKGQFKGQSRSYRRRSQDLIVRGIFFVFFFFFLIFLIF